MISKKCFYLFSWGMISISRWFYILVWWIEERTLYARSLHAWCWWCHIWSHFNWCFVPLRSWRNLTVSNAYSGFLSFVAWQELRQSATLPYVPSIVWNISEHHFKHFLCLAAEFENWVKDASAFDATLKENLAKSVIFSCFIDRRVFCNFGHLI